MDRQTAIDRITETENLTDGLEDDDANWLLNWGIAHVDGLVTGIKDEEAAGDKLNQLMSVMRTLNQVASDRAAKPPDALAGDIRTFLERYQQAFGAPKTAASTATTAPTTDAKTTPAASQKPSTPPTTPKDGQGSGAPPSTTPPAAKAGGDQSQQATTSGKPSKPASDSATAITDEAAPSTPSTPASTPPGSAPASATTPATTTPPVNTTASGAAQASQSPDQATQAASKIGGMAPKEAMQYLLSLAEAGAPAA